MHKVECDLDTHSNTTHKRPSDDSGGMRLDLLIYEGKLPLIKAYLGE